MGKEKIINVRINLCFGNIIFTESEDSGGYDNEFFSVSLISFFMLNFFNFFNIKAKYEKITSK